MSPAPLNGHKPATPDPATGYMFATDVVQGPNGPAIRYTVQTAAVSASWLVAVDNAEDFCKGVAELTAETVRQYRRKASGLVLPSET